MTRRKTTTIRRGLQMHPLPALHVPCLKENTPWETKHTQTTIIMQRPLLESEIVKLLLGWEIALSGSGNLVLCSWRRKEILRPPAMRRSPEEATGAAHDSSLRLTSPCRDNWDLGRIKAEYFNLVPQFTWLCQSNYPPRMSKMQLQARAEHTYRHTRTQRAQRRIKSQSTTLMRTAYTPSQQPGFIA